MYHAEFIPQISQIRVALYQVAICDYLRNLRDYFELDTLYNSSNLKNK